MRRSAGSRRSGRARHAPASAPARLRAARPTEPVDKTAPRIAGQRRGSRVRGPQAARDHNHRALPDYRQRPGEHTPRRRRPPRPFRRGPGPRTGRARLSERGLRLFRTGMGRSRPCSGTSAAPTLSVYQRAEQAGRDRAGRPHQPQPEFCPRHPSGCHGDRRARHGHRRRGRPAGSLATSPDHAVRTSVAATAPRSSLLASGAFVAGFGRVQTCHLLRPPAPANPAVEPKRSGIIIRVSGARVPLSRIRTHRLLPVHRGPEMRQAPSISADISLRAAICDLIRPHTWSSSQHIRSSAKPSPLARCSARSVGRLASQRSSMTSGASESRWPRSARARRRLPIRPCWPASRRSAGP